MASELVFLFGAGASKGAGQGRYVLPCDPPLGTEVYDKLAERFPGEWGHSSRLGQYSDGLRKDFEKTMSDEVCLWNPSLSILEWQRKMALYFASFTVDSEGKDLYSRLLLFLQDTGKIRNSLFASLNYDCLFEQAAYRLGFQVDYACPEGVDRAIRVFKIHGSCNFVTEDIRRGEAYLTNPNSHLACGMECLQPVDAEKVLAAKFSDPGASYYPVMSLYSLGKDSLVAGTRIQQIRKAWSEYLSGALVAAIIGVRPNSEDTHIWTPIKSASAKLFYIGSENHFRIWASANSHFELLAETFKEGFGTLLGRLDY
jgi:hypothetical protein